jgi:hypothetical protein
MDRGESFFNRGSLLRSGLLRPPFSLSPKGLTLFLLIAFIFSAIRPAFGYGIGTDSAGFSLTGCGPAGKDFVPVHQRITLEAANVWTEVPSEIRNHLLPLDQINENCAADYNPGDGIIKGSKEEDEEFNPLSYPKGCLGPSPSGQWGENCSNRWNVPICGLGQEGCTWPNGFLEHFWNPDNPPIGNNQPVDGYDCGQVGGGYNQGLHDVPLNKTTLQGKCC